MPVAYGPRLFFIQTDCFLSKTFCGVFDHPNTSQSHGYAIASKLNEIIQSSKGFSGVKFFTDFLNQPELSLALHRVCLKLPVSVTKNLQKKK